MKRHVLLCIVFILTSGILYAQYNVSSDTTAIGLGATTTGVSGYKFLYQSHVIAHFGLGWYNDTDAPGAAMAYLGGYAGIKFFTGGVLQLTITNNGYVGLGTTTPRALFDVRSGSSPSGGDVPGVSVITGINQSVYQGTLSLESNSSVAADQGGTLVFKGIYTGSSPAAYAAIGGFKENSVDGNYAGYLALYSRTHGDANSERLRITSIGNVGIGTTSPLQKLHVDGVVRIDATGVSYNEGLSINVPPSMGGYGGITIHSTTPGSGYSASSIKWLLYHNYTPENNVGGGGFAIAQNNTDTRFYISNTGDISIGTIDSRGYKLAVAGDAIAVSMTVKNYSDWPDYVFKRENQLMSLTQVKAYIDKNQHLPEVPSANEIEKDGQNLGEMNKILLKKVEELTLYLIEQQKEIDELKKKVNKQ